MTAGCNFDGGDCLPLFAGAGRAALSPCNRTLCTHFQQDIYDGQCYAPCFTPECDFSRFLCQERI
jgi:hypothetical protein